MKKTGAEKGLKLDQTKTKLQLFLGISRPNYMNETKIKQKSFDKYNRVCTAK